MANKFLPYGRQAIDDEDIAAVTAALRSDYLTTGPAVAAYEQAFARRVGAQHAVACSSGTAGLHLAAIAIGLKPGDAAIVPTMTFLATANCVRYTGADVLFADVDPDTGLITPEAAADAFARAGTRKVKALFVVQLNGQCTEMPKLSVFARTNGMKVVEDACHALGGTDGNGPVGACAHSDFAVFSMHAVKTVTMGEGGVVTTNDPAAAASMARARNHGMERDPAHFVDPALSLDADGKARPWVYEMAEPGYNYRATDLQCALGSSQMKKLDRFVARRAELVARYRRLLEPLAPMVKPVALSGQGLPAWHLCVSLIDFAAAGKTRSQVMRELVSRGIGTQVHYIPVHRQPYYRAIDPGLNLPGADAYYARALSLPLFVGMEEGDVDRVVLNLRQVLGL